MMIRHYIHQNLQGMERGGEGRGLRRDEGAATDNKIFVIEG